MPTIASTSIRRHGNIVRKALDEVEKRILAFFLRLLSKCTSGPYMLSSEEEKVKSVT